MAYDRNDTREGPRGDRSRWPDDRFGRDFRGRDEDRGFFERAGDEIASWFGDDDAERRRREDQRFMERERDRFADRGRFERDSDRSFFDRGSSRGYAGEGRSELEAPGAERGYRPMFGGYTVEESQSGGSGWGDRGPRGRDDYRLASYDGSERRHFDPHYHSWRQRQMDELDRDYDDYRRENQARFENDFGSWRERRQAKRGILRSIREHMEVVGGDDGHVGTVDRVAGDRVILAKSDPESGGVHHSLSCSDIGRVEGDRVILDCSADEARNRWRDETRGRALFEREDQGEMGDRMLDRSFEGTYR